MAAAEAAIANPLLDESSMKGARGLLISITGGRDLTLFEVDEAATRIREEVDQDANIILGATFDEDLEGVIRVSVVATGIDKKAHEISAAPIEIRQVPKPQPRPVQAESRPAAVSAAPAPQHYEAAAAAMEMDNDPVSEAIREAERTSLRPAAQADEFVPQNRLFRAPEPQPQPRPLMQPVAQAPVHRPEPIMQQPRMPRVEDFPPLVKAEMDAQQNARAAAAEPVEDRGPMGGLLKRLTAGLSSRRDDEAGRQKPAAPREPQFVQPQAESRRVAGPDAQLYAPRRGQLDDHGRLVPAQRPVNEDDQLEIPAFLRRQAN